MTTQKQTQINKTNPIRNNRELEEWSFATWQKRALFLCKRGNLETELLLQNYIQSLKTPLTANHQDNSTNRQLLKQKTELIDGLLLETEQSLFHWLLSSPTTANSPLSAPPAHYLQLIQEIRDNYLNSNN